MRRVRTLFVVVTLAALAATGCQWNFQTLDGHQNGPHGQILGNAGAFGDALLYNDRPNIFYYDFSHADLRHAYWSGSAWGFETLDGHQDGPHGQIDGQVGAGQMAAILYNGRPHVFYVNQGTVDLRHAYWNGSYWSFETLDGHQNGPHGQIDMGVGRYVSATLYNGRPHVFYYDESNGNLRHGYWNGSFWAFETLDGHQNGPNGRVNREVGNHSAVTLYNDRPHVFYFDGTDLTLRHAYYTGSAWGFETLDGNGGPNGRVVGETGLYNEALVYHSRPQVFYRDNTHGDLRHAFWNGSAWVFETLDGNQIGPNGRTNLGVGVYNSAFVDGEKLRVFNYQNSTQMLRQAYYTGSAWGFETLDGHQDGPNGQVSANVGSYIAAIKDGAKLRAFYYAIDSSDLRHAYFG